MQKMSGSCLTKAMAFTLVPFLAVALILLSGILTASPSWSSEQIEKDLPVLAKAYSIKDQRADFIVAIDRSRSMREIWPEIKAQLLLFISALPESDYVSILGFAENADNLLLPRTLSTESREALRQELQRLPGPEQQPGNTGHRTDIRAAADLVLETLNRPGAARLTFVFVFTDFKHDPPAGSVTKAEGMRLLTQKFTNYVENAKKCVKSYAIQLPLSPDAGADVDILGSAFGGKISRVIASRSSLSEWFDTVRATFEMEKLRAVVEKDLAEPVVLSLSTSNNACTAKVRNKAKLSFDFSSLQVQAGALGYSSDGVTGVGPAEEKIVKALAPGFAFVNFLLPRQCRVIPVSMNCRLQFDAPEELARLNIPSARGIEGKPEIPACQGTPVWVHLLILACLASLVWKSYQKWFRRKLPFEGRALTATLFVDGYKIGEAVTCKPSSGGTISVPLDAIQESVQPELVAFARKRGQSIISLPLIRLAFVGAHPRFPGSLPRRGTYVSIDDSGSGAASRLLIRLKTYAESADPNSEGRVLQQRVQEEDAPVPEQEDISVFFRHSAENQAPMEYQILLSSIR